MNKRKQQQYGCLNQNNEFFYGSDSDDAVSATGTVSDDYRVELDADASPIKHNKNYNLQYPVHQQVPSPKDDQYSIIIRDDQSTNEVKDDQENDHKNTLRKAPKYDGIDGLLNTFLKYKNMALKQYLFSIKKNFMIFKFKQKNDRESFPIYIDKQYHTIHWICVIVMILQIICLHYVHINHNINDIEQQFMTLDTNFYVLLCFVVILCILLIFAMIPCISCHDLFSEQSTTCFTLSIGITLLYLIILYAIFGSITSDRFLIYFLITLILNTCCGYIKFMQYMILSFIVMVEFVLCAVLRWQHIITYTNTIISNPQQQIPGVITTNEFYFASIMVLFAFLFIGYHIYQSQQRLSYEYIQTSQIYQYAKTNHLLDKNGNIPISFEIQDIPIQEHVQAIIDVDDHDEDISMLSSLDSKQNNNKPSQIIVNDQHSDASSDDVDISALNESSIIYSLSTTEPGPHLQIPQNEQEHEVEMESIQFMENENDRGFDDDEEHAYDKPFLIISLIAHCKYLAAKAAQGITEIYHVMDKYDNIAYNESRTFHDIDQHWIRNKQKLNAAKHASERGKSLNKKKKKTIDFIPDFDDPQSPFKERLPAFIKNTPLFELNAQNAAASLSANIIQTSLGLHFPETMKRLRYPNRVTQIEINRDILPDSIELDDIVRSPGGRSTKLFSENGKNIERELMQKYQDKVEYFSNLVESELMIWIEPLEGIECMTKKDKETQRCVTILIGIADCNTKRPIAGIIHRPFTNETVLGIPHIGVYTYNLSVNATLNALHSKRVVVATYTDIVKDYLQKCCPTNRRDALMICAGIGHNVLLLIENECDVFLHPDHANTHKWHICAIEAVIQSLGGDFTQIDGKQYEYTHLTTKLKKGFVATLYGSVYHQQFQYKQYFG